MSELRRFEKWFERPNEHYDPVDGDFVGSMYDIAKVAWMAKADDVDKRIEELKHLLWEEEQESKKLDEENSELFGRIAKLEYKKKELKQRNKEIEEAYTVLALKISQYLNGNLSVSAEDIKKEWKRGEQLLKGGK